MKQRTKSIKENLTVQEPPTRQRKKSETKNQHKSKQSNESFVKAPKNMSKQAEQVKKYLQKTLNILSHRFNVKLSDPTNKQASILNLSSSLYKMVKQNVQPSNHRNLIDQQKQNICPNIISTKLIKKQSQSKIREEVLKEGRSDLKTSGKEARKVIMSEVQDNSRQKANSALANYSILDASSICQSSSIIPPNPNMPPDNSAFVKRRSNSTLDSYFREKFGSNAQDEQAVEKKLRVIKALKKSQEIVTKSNRSHVQSSMMLSSSDVNEKSIFMEKLKNKYSEKIR